MPVTPSSPPADPAARPLTVTTDDGHQAFEPLNPDRLQLWRLLWQRFREDRLGVTAGSLTFTTLIALVPLLTVTLALFTAFPMFNTFQGALERLFLQNLVPDSIARPVLTTLSQFAGKASRMGAVGLVALTVTALALMLTIDRALNAIWRVRRVRPLGQRLLIYWAALTVGPLVLGASLTLTWSVLYASRGWVGAIPGGFGLLLDGVQFALLVLVASGLFHFVPHTEVRWRYALAGGLFVGVAIEIAKKGLAWYVGAVPTLTSVYGAFSIVPILLLWVYLVWVVVLLGAVIAAYAPVLLGQGAAPHHGPGQEFRQALSLLDLLVRARDTPARGLDLRSMSARLRADPLVLEPLLHRLSVLGWVSRLDEGAHSRWVLLADPRLTPAAALVDTFLLAPDTALQGFRRCAGVDAWTLADLLPTGHSAEEGVRGA